MAAVATVGVVVTLATDPAQQLIPWRSEPRNVIPLRHSGAPRSDPAGCRASLRRCSRMVDSDRWITLTCGGSDLSIILADWDEHISMSARLWWAWVTNVLATRRRSRASNLATVVDVKCILQFET